ncbi:ATP-grasp domain-containing protein [Neolewinella antarctica]|uniref:Glutathione synthase n=1 Tax=Neolewinella antarctica TaxID=442734 RepID=A0ABX0X973_9BACT|nr:glutathione synthetase [Neolewinella antarctica]NJC25781.1 glutathione synthase [Neolewinella antarctica]
MRTLILTDHSGHSDQNSVYALARCLANDPRSSRVDVASRGSAQNTALFQEGALARVQGITVREQFEFDPTGRQFAEQLTMLHPKDYDLIWLRLPHPIAPALARAMNYLDQNTNTVVINRPSGMLETGDKAWLLNWEKYSAPMALVKSDEEVLAFTDQRKTVLKPLRAHGGKGIAKVHNGEVEVDGITQSLQAWLTAHQQELETDGYLAVKFLENVSKGDKRILVVNGKVLGASLRVPAAGEWLCNVAQGGTSVGSEITPEEAEMVAAISPALLEKGVVFYGMDTLEDDDGKRLLSELNTMSIGGFPQAEAQSGQPVVQRAIDEIFTYYRKQQLANSALRE